MTLEPEGLPRRGIQSIEVGGKVLLAMVHGGRPMPLRDIAREADMAAGKVHPYLVSFTRLGLIDQDKETGLYSLGPLALQMGLISLKQANPVQMASAAVTDLAQRLGHTVAISVWGSRGPTIVRLEESPAAIHVSMRHGTVFSLAGTATGRLFAAYQRADDMQRFLDGERKRQKSEPDPIYPGIPPTSPAPSWREFERELVEVRAHGLSRSEGDTVPGVNAMAAPVFDYNGSIALAITAIGPAGVFDSSWDGPIAGALRGSANQISQRLGAPAIKPFDGNGPEAGLRRFSKSS